MKKTEKMTIMTATAAAHEAHLRDLIAYARAAKTPDTPNDVLDYLADKRARSAARVDTLWDLCADLDIDTPTTDTIIALSNELERALRG